MRRLIFLFFTLLVYCCKLRQPETSITGNIDDYVIKVAIKDFIKNKRLVGKDSVFDVQVSSIKDNGNVIVVNIGKNNTRLLMSKNTKIGIVTSLPSRVLEENGRLFFWRDSNYVLTDSVLTTFKRYNLLQDDNGGLVKLPDFIIEDAKKAVHYYFCKNNPAIYEKVITKIGLGYYKPPKLKCR